MSAVYSTSFMQRLRLDGGSPYTVPAGVVAVLRDWDAYVRSDDAIEGSVALLGGAGQIVDSFTMAAGVAQKHQWTGRQVIPSGQTFTVSTPCPVDVTLSGYLLTLP
jgi:hypothetical protein